MEFIRNLSSRIFKKSSEKQLEEQILGTLYGNCVGDAIGLLTEFMSKSEAKREYGEFKTLEYKQKVPDFHRERWEIGDWTDDTDQMSLIMDSLLANKGKVVPIDFAERLLEWKRHGIPEVGDKGGGMGIGATTSKVLAHPEYKIAPSKAAEDVWEQMKRRVAPNGAVMRTSVLGIFQYDDMEKVVQNARSICTVTHFDPRCQASCVAVTSAIALMLQRRPEHVKPNRDYDIKAIMDISFQLAQRCLPDGDGLPDSDAIEELRKHMYASSLKDLDLAEGRKIGYTYKCMGAGFWALRQSDFRTALTAIVFEGGDADTNGAVAGALLGCKLGFKKLPRSWVVNLKHAAWMQEKIDRFLILLNEDKAARTGETKKGEEKSAEEKEEEKENNDEEKEEEKTSEATGGREAEASTEMETKPSETTTTTTTTETVTTETAATEAVSADVNEAKVSQAPTESTTTTETEVAAKTA